MSLQRSILSTDHSSWRVTAELIGLDPIQVTFIVFLSDAIVGISKFERLGVPSSGRPGQQHSQEDQETVRG